MRRALVLLAGVASLASVALSLAAVGCGGDERVAPLETAPTPDAGVGPSDDGGVPAVDAGPVKRDVLLRNPYGARPGNLLHDGDFEMSTQPYPYAQLGWRTFSTDGSTELVMATETGGLCRSGMRCAVLQPGSVVLIHGAAAPGMAPMRASIAVKPSAGGCGGVSVLPISCTTFTAVGSLSVPPAPGADGWCVHTGVLPGRDSAVCIYVSSSLAAGTTALLDDARLEADPTASGEMLTAASQPSTETRANLERLRARVRGGMRLGPSAPRSPRRGP